MKNNKHITGIILAGGKSSRMGTDKGLLMLNGKAFIQSSIDALKPLVSEIIIVSDNPDYDAFGYKRVQDVIKNAGPVAGIYAGLEASITNFNLILSCDIPLVNSEILKKLVAAIDGNTQIIQIESEGKSMPLIALYKKEVGTVFKVFLKQNEKRLRKAIKGCTHKNIVLNKKEAYCTLNVNTQDELKAINYAYKH